MTNVYALRESLFSPAEAALDCEQLISIIRNPGPSARYYDLERNRLFLAIRHASPRFAATLVKLATNIPSTAGASTEAVEATIRRYASRAATRATPFGLFAGVGRLDSTALVSFVAPSAGDEESGLIGSSSVDLNRDAFLYTNNTIRMRDGYVEIPEMVLAENDAPTKKVRFRCNSLVADVLEFCTFGKETADVDDFISRKRQGTDQATRDRLLLGLIRSQALFQLTQRASLRVLLSGSLVSREGLEVRTERVTGPPPSALERRMASVTRKIFRIPQFRMDGSNRDGYSGRFLNTYGAGVAVPYLVATDPIVGLGLIDLQVGGSKPHGPELHINQRKVLEELRLRGEASPDHSVELTERQMEHLIDPERLTLQADVDILYTVGASGDGETAPRFGLLPSTGTPGQSIGRFWHLFEADHFADAMRPEGSRGERVEPVDLRHLPRHVQNLSVMDSPVLDMRYIAVGYESDDADCISLNELLLFHDGDRLELFARGSDIPLRVRNLSMFNYPRLATRHAQTILTIASEPTQEFAPFYWGPESNAFFLPSVSYRGVTLTRAMWKIPKSLFDKRASHTEWAESMKLWRDSAPLPVEMEFGTADNLLRLSPYDQSHFREIRRVIDEADPTAFKAPIADERVRPVEYVQRVHIGRKTRSTNEPRTYSAPRSYVPSKPADDWISIELVNAGRAGPSLADALPVIAHGLSLDIRDWHFVRYNDPDNHLRLRFRVIDDVAKHRESVFREAQSLLGSALTNIRLVPFLPEYQRYGGPGNFPAVAGAFTVSSDAALALESTSPGCSTIHRMSQAVISAMDVMAQLLGEGWERVVEESLGGIKALPYGRRDRTQILERARELAPIRPPRDGSHLTSLNGEQVPTAGVVRSVLHLHGNRFFGYDPEAELSMIAILRSCLSRGVIPVADTLNEARK